MSTLIEQACRGGRFDYGVEMETTDSPEDKPVPEAEMKDIVEKQVRYCVCVILQQV